MININPLTNSCKIILHLCCDEDFASDSMEYARAGYDVRRIHQGIGVENYHPPEFVYGIIANPPCTMFSLARTRSKTPRDLKEGMRLVIECQRIIYESQYFYMKKFGYKTSLKFWYIENPWGFLRFFLGKPVLIYQPFEYGENYSKKTCLWGNFNIPQKIIDGKKTIDLFHIGLMKDIKSISDVHNNPKTRQRLRSLCSKKFAKAFFEANQ